MTIRASVIADMLAHAREQAPRECCGLLLGTPNAVVRSVRAGNLESKATRYLIDPKDHFAAIHAARAAGLEVIGAYHSHPHSASLPSAADIAEADSPGFLYVIVSLLGNDVRAFRSGNGTLTPCPLIPAA